MGWKKCNIITWIIDLSSDQQIGVHKSNGESNCFRRGEIIKFKSLGKGHSKINWIIKKSSSRRSIAFEGIFWGRREY